MKKIIFAVVIAFINVLSCNAQSYSYYSRSGSYYGSRTTSSSTRYQNGYYRSNGTYVRGHYKTSSNNTNHDNYSTKGNVNTFTGSVGTRGRDYSYDAYNYGQGKVIHTGPRGGQYYINSKGNKTYVPKR